MNSPKISLLIVLFLLLSGCNRQRSADSRLDQTLPAKGLTAATQAQNQEGQVMQQVSLKQADQSQSVAEAMDRKIIRNADLTLEVAAATDAQRKITSIAESLGGFVVTSESKQRENTNTSQPVLEIMLVVRVPASQFASALDQIHATGTRIIQEKIADQDVTEEFIDLEARIKAQKALEAQFLEIMKQANKVPDALEVQRQNAEVRTEIEKLEGRKRFLQNRASLSTITVNLQPPTTIVVSTSSFGRSIREAVTDSVDIAGAIVLFLIRFVIVMIPIFLLVLLPVGLVARHFVRRARRMQLARGLQADSQSA
jgi:hypothetical protein